MMEEEEGETDNFNFFNMANFSNIPVYTDSKPQFFKHSQIGFDNNMNQSLNNNELSMNQGDNSFNYDNIVLY